MARSGRVPAGADDQRSPPCRGSAIFALVGRLKPGVTDAQAEAELRPIFQEFSLAAPYIFPKNLGLGILPFDEMFKSNLASTIHLLLGSVFVLLFIACVNVSGLLLARAVKREHEFVVRASIGASRIRLVRHALTESLLLALTALPVAHRIRIRCAENDLAHCASLTPFPTKPWSP